MYDGIFLKKYEIKDQNGQALEVSETDTPDAVLLRIHGAEGAASIILSEEQWKGLSNLRYRLDFRHANQMEA